MPASLTARYRALSALIRDTRADIGECSKWLRIQPICAIPTNAPYASFDTVARRSSSLRGSGVRVVPCRPTWQDTASIMRGRVAHYGNKNDAFVAIALVRTGDGPGAA